MTAYRLPSFETIYENADQLGFGKVPGYNQVEIAKIIRRILEDHRSGVLGGEEALVEINGVIWNYGGQTFGVEEFPWEADLDGSFYIEAGDMYGLTFIYDDEEGRIVMTDYETFMKRKGLV